MSRNFIECAVNQNHIEDIRFMPFEDVAVGMLAERCEVTPVKTRDRRAIRLYRTKTKQEKKFVKLHLGKIERHRVPGADIRDRIIQHRIYDEEDMLEHHKTVLDPTFVPEKRKEWLRKVAERENFGSIVF